MQNNQQYNFHINKHDQNNEHNWKQQIIYNTTNTTNYTNLFCCSFEDEVGENVGVGGFEQIGERGRDGQTFVEHANASLMRTGGVEKSNLERDLREREREEELEMNNMMMMKN